MLKISNLTKNYDKLEVLKNINLELKEGEIISILGDSGCGKTTLLRIIAGLENKNSGKIEKKCDTAFMFQQYALFPNLSVFDNVAFALHKINKQSRIKRTLELLDKFQISQISDKKPDEISGGQAQRVAFARAIANGEKLILLDEPFSNLDENLKNTLRTELKDLILENKLSAIIVTHDKFDAFLLSDKIAIMHNGEILDFNTPKNLYTNPKNEKIAKSLGDVNVFLVKDLKKLPENLATTIAQNRNLIRPESFYIDKYGYDAQILKTTFLGQYYKIEAQINSVKFFMFCKEDIKENLKVNIKI